MIDYSIETLKNTFSIKKKYLGANMACKIKMMHYDIEQYEINDVGNLAVLKGKALFGLLKKDILILTPSQVDAPLFYYEKTKINQKEKIIVNLFETLRHNDQPAFLEYEAKMEKINEQYNNYFDPSQSYWYDCVKLKSSYQKQGKNISNYLNEHYKLFFDTYIEMMLDLTVCTKYKKDIANKAFCDCLFEYGAPLFCQFVGKMKKEAACEFFRSVIFDLES